MREGPTFWQRLYAALGPVAGGMLLDGLDIATFGPMGIYVGWAIGAAVGWWLAGIYGFRTPGRLAIATAAAVYLTVPFSEPFPVATAVSAAARFFRQPPAGAPPSEPPAPEG